MKDEQSMNEDQEKPQDLRQRTKQFALRVIRLYSALPKTTEAQVIGKQVLRPGHPWAHITVKQLGHVQMLNSSARSKADFRN